MKVCSKCKIEKELSEFVKDNRIKDGYAGRCKSCINKYKKGWNEKNKGKCKEYQKKYYKNNKDEILNRNKEYNKEYRKEYYKKNKEYHKEYHKKYYKKNKEILKEKYKEYRKNSKEYRNRYNRNRKKTDHLYKLKCTLRSAMWRSFKKRRWNKNSKSQELLGCDFEIVKTHLEKQFTKDMNWGNYGKWHIDHIIPLSVADNKHEVEMLCHYTNLQPLWAKDNFSKSDSFE